MSALLAARLPGPTTSASISADELNAVLARIRARCRPDLAVSAAQRLEALLGVAEASRAELRAARSGATGWLGLGSVAFVGSVDRAEAEAGRASEAVSFGAAALRSYADVAQTCLDRCWGLEHQLLVAYDERSRGLAAEATAESVPPAGRGADQLFDSVTGDLLRAARLLLEEVEAAIAALMARLSRLAVGSALPGDIALGLGPDAISLGCPRGGLSDWWGVGKEIRTGVGSAMTLWTGAKALSMFAAYARAQQGVAQGLAATRYLASLQPFLGALACFLARHGHWRSQAGDRPVASGRAGLGRPGRRAGGCRWCGDPAPHERRVDRAGSGRSRSRCRRARRRRRLAAGQPHLRPPQGDRGRLVERVARGRGGWRCGGRRC